MQPITKRLEANGITLEYNLWAKEGAPTVVLLHGVTSTKESYDLMVPYLLDTCQVLSLDQRGHGQSSKQGPYTFDNLIEDLRSVLDAEAIAKAVLVGGSFASVPVQLFALRYPDRVNGLVLLDGGYFRLTAAPGYDLAQLQKSEPFTLESVEAADKFVATAYGAFMNEAVATQMKRELQERPDGKVGFFLPHEAYVSYISEYADWDLEGVVPQLSVPVLVLLADDARLPDERKAFLATSAAAYESLAKQAQVVKIPNSLHALMLTKPQETAELVIPSEKE